MRTKLLIVILCSVAAFFLFTTSKFAQILAPSAASRLKSQGSGNPNGDVASSNEANGPSEGQILVRQAEATLQRHYTVSAQVTQKSYFFGHETFGSGAYFEQRLNQGLLFRLELNIRTRDDKLASGLLQVSDGRYLWNYRKLRGSESLSRVDLALVRQRLDEVGGAQTVRVLDSWPGIGGLPKLLRSFDKAFIFDKPEGVQLQADFPAWKVEGRWRPEMLVRAVPDHKDAIEQGRGVDRENLPEHLPNSVILFLGKEDFFPYSIVYYRLKGTTADVKASPNDVPMVRIIMKNVRFNQQIHAAQFVYKPGLEHTDQTEQMLEKLGLE